MERITGWTTIQTYQSGIFTKLVSNCGTVAGRRKSKSTSVNLLHNLKKNAKLCQLHWVIHGMTKSEKLIDILHKCGICVSYNNLLLLYAIWALRNAEISKNCPRCIAYGKPSTVTVDNDDFKIDTLTGNASSASLKERAIRVTQIVRKIK